MGTSSRRNLSKVRLFASWGWKSGDPGNVKYMAVECPKKFVEHVGSLYGKDGPTDGNDTPTPVPTAAPCKAWCADKAQNWDKKCRWKNCAGCPECTRRLRGSTGSTL